jgi:hypothetical protein
LRKFGGQRAQAVEGGVWIALINSGYSCQTLPPPGLHPPQYQFFRLAHSITSCLISSPCKTSPFLLLISDLDCIYPNTICQSALDPSLTPSRASNVFGSNLIDPWSVPFCQGCSSRGGGCIQGDGLNDGNFRCHTKRPNSPEVRVYTGWLYQLLGLYTRGRYWTCYARCSSGTKKEGWKKASILNITYMMRLELTWSLDIRHFRGA